MAVVYRYTDLADNIIKYVGIVWSNNRTLNQRCIEHEKNDAWCKEENWKVEYLKKDVTCRTDAEALESQYISKFETDKYFNTRKAGWGTSNVIDDSKDEWETFKEDEPENEVSSLINTIIVEGFTMNTKSLFPALELSIEGSRELKFSFSVGDVDILLEDANLDVSPSTLERVAVSINPAVFRVALGYYLLGVRFAKGDTLFRNFLDNESETYWDIGSLKIKYKISEISGSIEYIEINEIKLYISDGSILRISLDDFYTLCSKTDAISFEDVNFSILNIEAGSKEEFLGYISKGIKGVYIEEKE